ncbi:MAG: VCBS repeat-containing protein [Acidobacteria bacterium]|nr:VCBS repeat-containing protein [Acidobacteriota bacterium]
MKGIRLTLTAMAATLGLCAQTVPHFLPPSAHTGGFGVALYWSVAGDFNGDGRMDLAAPDMTGASSGFYYTLARAEGGYAGAQLRVVGSFVQTIQAGDFNQDGRSDLLLTTTAGTMVLLADGAGGFAPARYVALPGAANYAATGDFNGDGKLDLVAAMGSGFAVALGTGTGSFQQATLLPQLSTFYVIAADLNNDGKLDFAGPVGTGGVSYLGNGDGTFGAPVSTVAIPAISVVADFNNDGYPDLAYLTAQPRQDGSNHAINIARGVGNGQFQPYSGYVLGVPMSNLAAGDFNADGKMDIATWVSSTGKVRVFAGNGGLTIGGDLLDAPPMPNGVVLAADMDGNGSKDLVFSWAQEFRLFRNTHGNPPLLAEVKMNPGSVVGGAANATGTVTLGGVAPAGGATVTLGTTDSSLVSFPAGVSVVIPAGASSATFPVVTVPVAAATGADVTATWNGVTTAGRLDVVAPYTLSGVAVNPGSQFGIFTATGTVTLSGPADGAAVVGLSSSNVAVASVPATVTVPAGATSANFVITLRTVAADTAVTIGASLGGVSRSGGLTVLRAQDTVAISKAIFTLKTAQIKVEAASTSAAATIGVYNPNTGALLGTLANAGGGKYNGTVFAPLNVTQIVLKSSLGGTVTGPVEIK